MSRTIYSAGDEVYYPFNNRPSDRTMTVLNRNINVYSSGKMFVQYLYDGLLEHLVEDMHDNVDNDFDNLIVVSGAEGTGKSNFAYHLCKLYDPNFSVESGYIYEYEAFIRMLNEDRSSDRGKIFWMDEATNIASNRDWNKSDNKTFIQLLEMMRSRGWTLVMCIPDAGRLDVYIRERRARYLLVCRQMEWGGGPKQRGYVEVRVTTGPEKWFNIGYAKFPRMPDDVKAEYEAVKRRHQDAKLEELQAKIDKRPNGKKSEDLRRLRAIALLAREQGIKYKDLAAACGVSVQTVETWVNKAKEEREKEANST